MSIAQRLIILMVISIGALLLASGGGFWELMQAKSRYDDTLDTLLPSNKDLTDATVGFIKLRTATTAHMLADSAEGKEQAVGEMSKADAMIDLALDHYKKFNCYSAADCKLLQDDQAAISTYRQMAATLLKLSSSDNRTAMMAYFNSLRFRMAASRYLNALQTHMDFKKQLADQIRQSNAAAFRQAMIRAGLSVLVIVVLLLLINASAYRSITRGLGDIQNTLQKVSGSLDFTLRAKVARNDEVGKTAAAFNSLLGRLQDNLRSLRLGAEDVAKASESLSQTASQVAAVAASQSSSSASVATTVQQMTVSVNQVSNRALETHSLATEAGEMAKASSATISQTITDIREISRSVDKAANSIRELENYSTQVDAVVGVIKDVADQTNLLALNASIEAARAGEMGRGFAVVADEVRKLAERTTVSTREISDTISIMQVRSKDACTQMQAAEALVRNGVTRADEADRAIRQIGDSTGNTVGMVSEISEAIREQGMASQSIAVQVESIAQLSVTSSSAAQETSQNASRLDQLAKSQIDTLANYRL